MCVVKVNPSLDSISLEEEGGPGDSGRSGSGGKLASSGSNGKLVPAIDGSGGMVEIVSPHDILQPGLYETWLVRAGEGGAGGRLLWGLSVHRVVLLPLPPQPAWAAAPQPLHSLSSFVNKLNTKHYN